jgi:DNA-binding response OmpR family regulator
MAANNGVITVPRPGSPIFPEALMASNSRKILVVDDEPNIVNVIRSYLEASNYQVYEALDGKSALSLFERVHPDLIILDLMLPEISGEEICRKIRNTSRVPIIMLTAKVEEEDIIGGLKLGADDYVTKPFAPRQLVARVEALLRRTANEPVPLAEIISLDHGALTIDNLKHEVRKNGQIVNLTPSEYSLLLTMVKFPNKAFTREELVIFAFGENYDGYDRTIDTHIKNLRQKLENEPKNPHYILTVHGIGYRFGGE